MWPHHLFVLKLQCSKQENASKEDIDQLVLNYIGMLPTINFEKEAYQWIQFSTETVPSNLQLDHRAQIFNLELKVKTHYAVYVYEKNNIIFIVFITTKTSFLIGDYQPKGLIGVKQTYKRKMSYPWVPYSTKSHILVIFHNF